MLIQYLPLKSIILAVTKRRNSGPEFRNFRRNFILSIAKYSATEFLIKN
jgi:hypothetical protein